MVDDIAERFDPCFAREIILLANALCLSSNVKSALTKIQISDKTVEVCKGSRQQFNNPKFDKNTHLWKTNIPIYWPIHRTSFNSCMNI